MSDARRIYDFMEELGMKPTPWQLRFLEKWLAAGDEPKKVDLNNRKKLSKRDVVVIRSMKRNGVSQKDIADAFDVHHATISRIIRGHYWK